MRINHASCMIDPVTERRALMMQPDDDVAVLLDDTKAGESVAIGELALSSPWRRSPGATRLRFTTSARETGCENTAPQSGSRPSQSPRVHTYTCTTSRACACEEINDRATGNRSLSEG